MGDEELPEPSGKLKSAYKMRLRRACPSKTDASSLEDAEKPSGAPKKSLKRKVSSSDDDPEYSDVEDEEDLSENQKKIPGYRCSPHLIPDLFESLSLKQKGWVKKIDFDSLQGMIDSRMPKSLTMWLVDRVDTSTGTLEVCGIPIDIREAVPNILKLPCGDIKVPPPLNGRSKGKRFRGDSSSGEQKYSDRGRGQTAKDATSDLLKELDDEEEFCRSFVLLVLCIYLAPTTSLNINRSYYPTLLDVTKIGKMDWCGFIADYLIQGIREYRNSPAHHVQVPGCVHLLPLIYIDALIKVKALALPECLPLPEGVPRIHYIGAQHLAYLASVDVKQRSKDLIEYGLLQESCIVGLFHKSSPQVCSNNSEKLPTGQSSVPSSASSLIGCETFLADFLRGLSHEINESRQQVVQDFQQKIGACIEQFLKKDLEASDMKVLARFERKFINQLSSRNASPPRPQEQNKSAEDLRNSCSHELRHSVMLDGQSSLPQMDPDRNDHSGIDVLGVESTVCIEKLKQSSISGPNNMSSSLKDTSSNAKVLAQQCMPPSRMEAENEGQSSFIKDYEHPKILQISESIPEKTGPSTSKKKNCRINVPVIEKDDIAVDELEEVVSIGAAAAGEATLNHEKDGLSNSHRISLSLLSEAAHMVGPALYDQSPAGFCYSTTQSIRGPNLDSSRSHSDSLFVVGTPRPAVESATLPLYGPTQFDSSPDTQFEQPSMDKKTSPSGGVNISPESFTEKDHADRERVSKAGSVSLAVIDRTPPRSNSPVVGSSIYKRAESPASATSDYSQRVDASNRELSLSQIVYDSSQTSETMGSDSVDETEPGEDPSEENYVDPESVVSIFVSPSYCNPTPSYTFDTQESIPVEDDPCNTPPNDIQHIPPLQEDLAFGLSFKLGGSVSIATYNMYEKIKQLDHIDPIAADIVHKKFVLTKDASKTYQDHVVNSSARISARFRHLRNQYRERTKIQIKGFHVTVGEFVDALKPNGKVCQNLMGLCSVAIMLDWNSNKKVILPQSFIDEFMKDGPACNTLGMASRLQKLPLDEVEQIFLPVLKDEHWILIVVNILSEIVEFYDSLLVVNPDQHPYKELWANLGGNLRESYCKVVRKSVMIDYFKHQYPPNKLQTTLHDCGFHVVQKLECHHADDLVGYSKKKTMTPYRKYLSHILIHHRFNDLNPLRTDIPNQISWS